MGVRETKRGAASALAVAFAVALACASVASADRQPETLISGLGAHDGFSLAAGHGYRLEVSGRGNRVSAAFIRFHGLQLAAADYSAKGRVSSNFLRADFGKVGKISVSFHPDGRVQVRPPPDNCEGKPAVVTKGTFRGRIRLRLEDGSLSVDTKRAQGNVTRSPKLHCHEGGRGGKGAGGSPHGPVIREVILSADDCGRTSVSASQVQENPANNLFPEASFTQVFASSLETRGRLRIVRVVAASSQKSPFTYAADLSSATLQPPPPFSGGAEFKRDPVTGEGVWTGSLAVDFPGRTVPLVGPRFDARLTRTKVTAGTFASAMIDCPQR